jgi:hypothetical protein
VFKTTEEELMGALETSDGILNHGLACDAFGQLGLPL